MHENPEALQIVEVHKQQLQPLNPSSPLGPMLCIIDLARAPPLVRQNSSPNQK